MNSMSVNIRLILNNEKYIARFCNKIDKMQIRRSFFNHQKFFNNYIFFYVGKSVKDKWTVPNKIDRKESINDMFYFRKRNLSIFCMQKKNKTMKWESKNRLRACLPKSKHDCSLKWYQNIIIVKIYADTRIKTETWL